MGKRNVFNKYIIKEGTLLEMGEKGYNLNLLRKKNIKVPDFFCFNSRAFEEALDFRKKEYLEKIDKIDYSEEETIETISKDIISKINQIRCFEFEDKINVYLREKYNENDLFKVRSSSTYEDMNANGRERIFEQFVNVKRADVFEHIRKCWNSMYSVESLKYFHDKQIDIKNVRMGVIIQKMDKEGLSGIAYTSNPKGLLNELIIVIGEGTSEEVAQRKVDNTVYHYNIDDKSIFYERTNNSKILELKDLKLIIDEVIKIKESFGKYIELEWLVTNGELYILQAKKIQSIDEKNKIIYLDNRDIVDKFPGVILPLTESFVKKAYAESLRNLTKRTLPNEELWKKFENNFDNIIYSVNGRLYCDIVNWNLLLQFIPQSNKILLPWQKKMGILEGDKSNKPKKGFEKKLTGGQSSKIASNSKKLFKNNKASMEKYIEDFNILYDSFNRKYSKNLSNSELINLYKEYVTEALKNYDLTFINEIYTYIFLEKLKLNLKKVKVEENDKFITKYISDIYNNETEKFLRDLFDIANIVDEKIKERLLEIDTNAKARAFIYEETEFSNKLREYVREYGNIVLDNLKIESTTFKSNPKLLIDKILEYVNNKETTKTIHGSLMNYENKDLPLIIKKKAGILVRWDIKDIEKVCREVVAYKEKADTIRTKIYDMVRVIFNVISKNMYNDGTIQSVNDIYYLKIDEIFDSIEGKNINLNEISLKRRQEYKCYYMLPSYTKLEFSGEIYNKYHVNINTFDFAEMKNNLNGICMSPGVAENEVVVVYNKDDLKDIQDKILVTETTDFGWFLDIAMSAGIITEYGSMFSGTSVLARDLKIPYVSGIKNITSLLKTGDKIILDGNTGKISILNLEEENKEIT